MIPKPGAPRCGNDDARRAAKQTGGVYPLRETYPILSKEATGVRHVVVREGTARLPPTRVHKRCLCTRAVRGQCHRRADFVVGVQACGDIQPSVTGQCACTPSVAVCVGGCAWAPVPAAMRVCAGVHLCLHVCAGDVPSVALVQGSSLRVSPGARGGWLPGLCGHRGAFG